MNPDAHLLQVCNVGQIAGGTAACAWSLVQALPQFRHTVAFLSAVSAPTRDAFSKCHIVQWPRCSSDFIRSISPDLVVLHNIAARESTIWDGAMSIQYIHSAGPRVRADATFYCSEWLADACRADRRAVLWQGVPCPLPSVPPPVRGQEGLKIGRLCTPTHRKWPGDLPDFYSSLASKHPDVFWEFVGCPRDSQAALLAACLGRARFYDASWAARSLFWNWDATLYHHSSLTESFGRTLAEAARAGCIPIMDDRGGFSEQLRALKLSGCGSMTDFSDKIDELRDRDLRGELSTRIQSLADEQFSIRAFGIRFRDRLNALATMSRP